MILLSVTGCKKESVMVLDKVPVIFQCGTNTRVLDDSWDAGDRIGVCMVRSSSPLADTSIVEQAANIAYETSVSAPLASFASVEAAKTIYYPLDGSAVDFYAYYPYVSNLSTYEYPINVTEQSSQSSLDLMTAFASGHTKHTTQVNLNFKHKLAKLKLTIRAGAGLSELDLQGLEVEVIGLYTKAFLGLSTDTILNRQSVADIKAKTSATGQLSEAILIPCTAMSGAKVAFKLQQTSEVFYWDISALSLQSGKKYDYIVTLSRTGANISGSISDWIGSSGNGSAN